MGILISAAMQFCVIVVFALFYLVIFRVTLIILSTVGQDQKQSFNKEKMNLKSRFIKKKASGNSSSSNNNKVNNGQKVQRSASAILRSKMYAVVAKKRKISKPPATNLNQPSTEKNNIGMYEG